MPGGEGIKGDQTGKKLEMLRGKTAVIFDLDGTLIDSMWLWKEIDIEYLGRFQIPYPEDLPDGIGGMSFSETAVFFQNYFQLPRTVEEIMEDWNEMALWKYTHEIALKPGAKEFLHHLKAAGIKLGIATSNSRGLVDEVLKAQDIYELFDVIRTGCEVGKGKPAPDIYLSVAKELGVAPKDCLVFEDVAEGIQAGKHAGMTVCAVEDEYSAYQIEEKRRLADYLLASFDRLEEAENLQDLGGKTEEATEGCAYV